MANILDELKKRGLIKQTIFEEDLHALLGSQKVVCYMGFDPSADSLHIGNLSSLLVLVRMQQAGHQPIALVGGATGRIGDPSGRNDMRPQMTEEQRKHNLASIRRQIESFFEKNGKNDVIVVDNDDWIKKLSYYDFLNEIGLNMSVNRMLSHDCFKSRMEHGLTLLEFNYMPMQAYDFLHLFRTYNCVLEFGGDDQWANILAGVELIRKKENKPVFCATVPLLTNSDGTKMGKSAGGAIWLSREKLSDYDFYQYFRDMEDSKVEELFRALTFLPLDEIQKICSVSGQALNTAKERLAFEVTKIVRGEASAIQAQEQARARFGGDMKSMETLKIDRKYAQNIVDLLIYTQMAGSRGEAKRLIEGKGIRIDDEVVDSFDFQLKKDEFVLQKGKKAIQRVKLV